MRIIAGDYKRRKLHEVPLKTTRSTKDRVKETMFNMVSPTMNITNTLDLFAGSGALGLEALSRHGCHADFVESNHQAFTVLKQNIAMLDLTSLTNIYHDQAIPFLTKQTIAYDFIILDPPYHQSLVDQALITIQENALLHPHGLMVSLTHKDETVALPKGITIRKQRTVGITTITFYETE